MSSPLRFIFRRVKTSDKMNGWLALSPLLVFLCVYLISSIIAHDFYAVPITAAFIIAVIYAILITRRYEKLDKIVDIFSDGAGNRNVLLMIWIFVLAGAFASTAKDIGAIDATVDITLSILPDRLIMFGLFFAACFISMSIGTSVGTIVALMPIATGIADETGINDAMLAAIIVGGAFFGDNLSFISDTTIAATQSQGCSMRDKFRVNIYLVIPAALIVSILYVWLGKDIAVPAAQTNNNLILILPYVLTIILAICGMNVATVLVCGILINGIIGFALGTYSWVGWLASIGEGVKGMGELIIITMMAGGMLELIRHNGGLDFIINRLNRRITTKRSAELTIAGLVSIANLCTANNTIAIITVGKIAKDITARFCLDPRKTASLLDTFSCLVQGLIPYGAQLLIASALSGISAAQIITHLYYPFILGIVAFAAILFRLPRRYS